MSCTHGRQRISPFILASPVDAEGCGQRPRSARSWDEWLTNRGDAGRYVVSGDARYAAHFARKITVSAMDDVTLSRLTLTCECNS